MRRSRHRLLEAIGAAAAMAVCGAATAQTPNASPPNPGLPAIGSVAALKVAAIPVQTLQLEVMINGRSTNLICAFDQSGDGALSISIDDLRALGLKPPVSAHGQIDLKTLPGVSFRYEERSQRLYLSVEDAALEPHEIWVRPKPAPVVVARSSWGALVNYDLFAQGGQALNATTVSFARLSSTFDARVFGPLGVFADEFTDQVGSQAGQTGLTRLGTSWTFTQPGAMVTAGVGDLISGGFEWTRPIRMAGFQLRRDFSLRPDLITMPAPTISGSAAVPSTVEVFANQQAVFAGGIEPGPFRLENLPITDGYSETSLVLRDASGVERRITAQFYATPDLLHAGLVDYSIETGFARRDFGVASADYDGQPVASASVRVGMTEALTLQGHAEGGAGVAEAGAGAVARIGGVGVLAVALASSQTEGQYGGQARIGIQAHLYGVSLGGSVQQTFGDFADVATVTQPRVLLTPLWKTMAAPAKQLTQLSLSTPISIGTFGPGVGPVISLAYAGRIDASSQRQDTLSLSARHTLSRFTAYGTAFQSVSGAAKLGFFFGISMSLTNRTMVSAGAESSDAGASAFVEASHQSKEEPGSSGWSVHADAGAQDDIQASANYMSRFGRLDGDAEVQQSQLEAQGRFAGALVAMDGGVFAAPTVQNAFAVVDAGQPGVAVRFQNRLIGVTDAQGRLLASGLNAYQANALDIDPTNLPLNVEVASTQAIATPAYDSGIVVKFDIKIAPSSALVTLRTPDGQVVAAGSQAALSPEGEALIVGYDGQVFIRRLRADNRLIVSEVDGSTCVAAFTFHPDTQDTIHALDAVCR